MLPCAVQEQDYWGKIFLCGLDRRRFEGYYASLRCLHALLDSPALKNHVSGFYINSHGEFNTVRVSYFSNSRESVTPFLQTELARLGLTIIQDDKPESAIVSKNYGEEELRFRKYLCCYSAVGLDLMKENLGHARCLLATFDPLPVT
jgi:hypothetical protein